MRVLLFVVYFIFFTYQFSHAQNEVNFTIKPIDYIRECAESSTKELDKIWVELGGNICTKEKLLPHLAIIFAQNGFSSKDIQKKLDISHINHSLFSSDNTAFDENEKIMISIIYERIERGVYSAYKISNEYLKVIKYLENLGHIKSKVEYPNIEAFYLEKEKNEYYKTYNKITKYYVSGEQYKIFNMDKYKAYKFIDKNKKQHKWTLDIIETIEKHIKYDLVILIIILCLIILLFIIRIKIYSFISKTKKLISKTIVQRVGIILLFVIISFSLLENRDYFYLDEEEYLFYITIPLVISIFMILGLIDYIIQWIKRGSK